MSGEWHARLGYLHWQAHACMCVVCSRHAHIIYLFTHIHSIPLGRTHAAEVLATEQSALISTPRSTSIRLSVDANDRLHETARFLESRIESYNVHAHSTRLLRCSEVNKGCYSEVIQLPFVSSIHFCMIFKSRHMVTFLIWQVSAFLDSRMGAVLGNLGCNRPSEHSLPEHAQHCASAPRPS